MQFKNPTRASFFILLLISGLLIYSNTLNFPFHFDDISFIAGNHTIRNIGDITALWNYWPTRFTGIFSFALDYQFHQLNVFGYRLVNVLIHICSSFLVFWLLQLTFLIPEIKAQVRNKNQFSIFVALIFLAHPLQTEAINYVFQRVTLLATLFYLSCLCFYIKAALTKETNAGLGKFYYFLSLVSSLLAMFSKEIAFTLPFVILLYHFSFLRKKCPAKWKYITPFFIFSSFIPVTILIAKPLVFMNVQKLLENPAVNSTTYLFTEFRVLVTYLRLLLLPAGQNLDYDYPISTSLWGAPVLTSLILLSLLLVSGIRLFSKSRLISFGIFWFFITLLPESSIIPLSDVIYEHRLYLPMVGLSICAVSFVYMIFNKKSTAFAKWVLLTAVICYSVLSYNRNWVWKDELSLWSDVIKKSPNKLRPYNERGLAYLEKADFGKSVIDFTRAVEIEPAYANGYYNRGLAYFRKAEYDRAISDFTLAIKLKDKFQKAYFNRALAYYMKKEYDLAASDFNEVLSITPGFIEAYYYLSGTYNALGKKEEAKASLDKAREITLKAASYYSEMADKYKSSGKNKEAVDFYLKALEFRPNDISLLDSLAGAYIAIARYKEAISEYKKILEIEPGLAAAHNNLAVAYYYDKQYDLAARHIDEAQKLGYKVTPKLSGLIGRQREQ